MMTEHISESVIIDAAPPGVWRALTQPELMAQWMGAPEMKLEIATSWATGTPVIIRGFHHVSFVNRGLVLHFEPERRLSYNHLDSVSRLEDKPENYTVLDFGLTPVDGQTLLTLTIDGFPTETIFQHLRFYWRTTIVMFKRFVEQSAKASP